MIRSSVRDIVDDYGRAYFREKAAAGEFPEAFWRDLGEHGWLGVAIPEAYGGQGLGMHELMLVTEEVVRGGGFPCVVELTHLSFGGETLSAHGSEAQKERWLPRIAAGEAGWSLGVTEADAGLNTLAIETTAEPDGDGYVINGSKAFISGVDAAERITLLARSLPPEEADRRTHGFTVFLVDPEADGVEYAEIPLDIYWPDATFNVYLDDVRVDESAVVGNPHEGLYHLFDTLNTERIITATTTNSVGRYAVDRAVEYATDREVFGVPIGAHQAIQHPLAAAYADLRGSLLLAREAAWRYDAGEDASEAANLANLTCTRAAWAATDAAVQTFGGMSAAAELEVSKLHQYVRHERIAPVSEEMLRNFVGHRILGLPKSY